MEYDAENNPNQFVFFMHDQKGGEVKVVLNKPKTSRILKCRNK